MTTQARKSDYSYRFVALSLATLEPNSTIRERLQLMVNDAGKGIELDSVIQVFQSWYRDQEIQKANDSFQKLGKDLSKLPRDPRALLLTIEDKKYFKGCT